MCVRIEGRMVCKGGEDGDGGADIGFGVVMGADTFFDVDQSSAVVIRSGWSVRLEQGVNLKDCFSS